MEEYRKIPMSPHLIALENLQIKDPDHEELIKIKKYEGKEPRVRDHKLGDLVVRNMLTNHIIGGMIQDHSIIREIEILVVDIQERILEMIEGEMKGIDEIKDRHQETIVDIEIIRDLIVNRILEREEIHDIEDNSFK